MTFSTTPLHNRLVFGDILLHPLHGIGVAISAQLGSWLSGQPLVVRRMWVVAAKTAFLAYQGPMHAILVKCLVEHVIMTAPAKPRSLFFRLERSSRGRFLVTLIAHALGYRRMHILEENPHVV